MIPKDEVTVVDPAYSDIAEHLRAGRIQAFADALRQAVQRDGERPALLRLLARHHEETDHFEQACAIYKRLAETDEMDAELCWRLARCDLLTGRPYEAAAYAKQLSTWPAFAATSQVIQAAVLSWKGKWADARNALDIDLDDLDMPWYNDAHCRRILCDNVLELQKKSNGLWADLHRTKPPLHIRKNTFLNGVTRLDRFNQGQWTPMLEHTVHEPVIPPEQAGTFQAPSVAFASVQSWQWVRYCLANRSPQMVLNQQQSLFVIEPDLDAFLGLAMLEDLTQVLASNQVRWFLGPEAHSRFSQSLTEDPRQPLPPVTVGHDPVVTRSIEQAGRSRTTKCEQRTTELQAYYRALPDDHGKRVFSMNLGRPPRVYLLTSRFTTVLQFVTRDMEQAFRRLGWDTRLAIEPDDTKMTSPASLLEDLINFKPDVVFMMDHLRYECNFQQFPELYFMTWIQDQMPNLYCTQAGESITDRDFVLILGGGGVDLIHNYHYPQRSLVTMHFSVNLDVFQNSESIDLSGYDIPKVTYASNHGHPPDGALRLALQGLGANPPSEVSQIAQPYLNAVLQAYATGNILYEDSDYDLLLRRTEAETGIQLPNDAVRVAIEREFRLHVGSTVHRQEVLRWLKEGGVDFGVFGREWDRHPEFSEFSKGVVDDASTMNAIFRASPINLQLGQYSNSHIRFWNGLAAGGFFLVRTCPIDNAKGSAEETLDMLAQHKGKSYACLFNTPGVTPWHERHIRGHFEGALARREIIDDYAIEMFALTLDWETWRERMGDVADKIQFSTKDQCLSMVKHYLSNPSARQDILHQLDEVLKKQTYEANLKRALKVISDRVNRSSRPAPQMHD